MVRALLLLAGALCMLNATAQHAWRARFGQRMEALNAYLRFTDTLGEEQRWADTLDVNDAIAERLIAALEVPGVPDATIDSAFAYGWFGMASSDDRRLRIFSWDERTGGTFRSQANVVFFRKADGTPIARSAGTMEGELLCGLGAGYHNIHVLRSDMSTTLYACEGFVVGCATCCADVVSLLELGPDAVLAPVGLFTFAEGTVEDGEEESDGTVTESERMESSCFVLEARCGDKLGFEYDAARQVFSFAYFTDDLTPVRQEEGEESRKVTGRLRFNGEQFILE